MRHSEDNDNGGYDDDDEYDDDDDNDGTGGSVSDAVNSMKATMMRTAKKCK